MSNVSTDTSRYLIRVEGVNMDAYLFNTNDLSAMRGAGLSLLKAVPRLVDSGNRLENVETISLGASSGLFLVTGETDAMALRTDVKAALMKAVPHGTFVVDVLPVSPEESFRKNVEKLIAMNRWRQAMACSLSLPDKNTNPKTYSKPACALEGTRPAVENDGIRFLSTAVKWQRDEGNNAKQNFYEEITGFDGLPNFSNSFEDIAVKMPILDGKMAVFYADGNSFGKIQQEYCKSPESQRKYDKTIRDAREDFLKKFLEKHATNDQWLNGNQMRFETLLWGGDEFMFVMPAALGWSFAIFFFDHFKNMNFEKKPMTFTASMVYCHHHAPIRRIKHLVKDDLAELAKGAPDGREQNQLIVHALESYDNLGEDVREGLERYYQGLATFSELLLRQTDKKLLHEVLVCIRDTVDLLKKTDSCFARSQLRGLVNRMIKSNPTAVNLASLETTDQYGTAGWAFRNTKPEVLTILRETFSPLFTSDSVTTSAAWLHLEELWDYAR